MRTGIFLNYAGGFLEAADQVVELEKLGVDIALVAEAYAYDAISQLGFLAAKTSRIELGTGVVPIFIRTPSLLAMTAAGLDYVSDGRFRLGIGTRDRRSWRASTACRSTRRSAAPARWSTSAAGVAPRTGALRREVLPDSAAARPGTGLGKPLQLINHPVRERIPITIAALGPKNVELTAEIAEGWQPVFFLSRRRPTRLGRLAAVRVRQTRPGAGSA